MIKFNVILATLLLLFSIYMLIRNYYVSDFRDRCFSKNIKLWIALMPYTQMLYRVFDWKFNKMIRSDFYKYSGLTKSELLEMLKDI